MTAESHAGHHHGPTMAPGMAPMPHHHAPAPAPSAATFSAYPQLIVTALVGALSFRRFNAFAIKRLKEIQCYRGVRHIQGLPCRGQRTKNNCRTLKGKKIVAGKKKVSK
ncbi:hypothetical protein Bca101_024125 [Brassica carinata]